MQVLLDCLHVIQVHFITKEHHNWQFLIYERLLNEIEPVLQVLEGLLICYIVREDYSVGFVNVCSDHFRENALSTDVPDLERYLNVTRELDSLDEEVDPNCLLVRAGKVIFTESHD